MEELSRRSFVKSSAATGIAATVMGSSPLGLAFADEAATESISADIAVVGGGGAGLSAAIQAVELGASVVLLEQLGTLGGNAGMTEGIFAVGSPLQKEAGIADIPISEIIEEEMTYTNFRSCGPLLYKYFSASGENIQWLLDQGVAFKEVSDYRGVSSFDCFHWWEGNRGAEALATLAARTEEVGVDIRLNTVAQELIFDGEEVAGVRAVESETGKQIDVTAKAVIIASGGFAADLERVKEMTWVDPTGVTPYGSNNGVGIKMALSAGAGTTSVCGLFKTQVLGDNVGTAANIAACFQPLLMVNEYGERFAREDLNITSYSALYFNAINSQRKAFSILDGSVINKLENEGIIYAFVPYAEGDKMEGLSAEIEEAVSSGNPNCFKGETLEELAQAMGVNPETLASTVEHYNELCEAGQDTDYGKGSDYLYPVIEGPFYAFLQSPAIYVTIGGIDVDTDNQVVDADGTKIAHLYSAGVDCCKLYRETYNYQLSGGMIGYCIYSGRNAAQSACATI